MGWLSPARTRASNPSTSILQKSGSPWVATSRSRVVTGTSTSSSHRTPRNPDWAPTSRRQEGEADDTVGFRRLTLRMVVPGASPTASPRISIPSRRPTRRCSQGRR